MNGDTDSNVYWKGENMARPTQSWKKLTIFRKSTVLAGLNQQLYCLHPNYCNVKHLIQHFVTFEKKLKVEYVAGKAKTKEIYNLTYIPV